MDGGRRARTASACIVGSRSPSSPRPLSRPRRRQPDYEVAGCDASRSRWAVGRPRVGRGPARTDPSGRAGADGARPQPVPHLGGDVGRVGGVRRRRRRLPRHREGRRRGRRPRPGEAAISYAVYRLLLWRYGTVSDLPVAAEQLDAVMASLCYRTDFEATDGDSPAALGNRIAAALIEYGSDDGALENERYVDSSYTRPTTRSRERPGHGDARPQRVAAAGPRGADRPERAAHPRHGADDIGPHWGHVTSFAMPPSERRYAGRSRSRHPASATRTATRRSSRPRSTCSATAASSMPTDGVEIDIGPGAIGRQPARHQRR